MNRLTGCYDRKRPPFIWRGWHVVRFGRVLWAPLAPFSVLP